MNNLIDITSKYNWNTVRTEIFQGLPTSKQFLFRINVAVYLNLFSDMCHSNFKRIKSFMVENPAIPVPNGTHVIRPTKV